MEKRTIICAFVSATLSTLALLAPFVSPVVAQTTSNVSESRSRVEIPTVIVVTEAHIAILKNVLNLRPEQESYWLPVETALRDLVQWQATIALQYQTVEYTNTRPIGSNAVMARLKRIAAAAVPLIKTLDENQNRDVMMLARIFGFEHMLATF